MAEPTQSVFDVIEVLEIILLQLPMKDILHFKGVNRTWKTLIMTSTQLRKALFLISGLAKDAATNAKKATITLKTKAGKLENLEIAFNPLLVKGFDMLHVCMLQMRQKSSAIGKGFGGIEMHLTQPPLELEGVLKYEVNFYMGLSYPRRS